MNHHETPEVTTKRPRSRLGAIVGAGLLAGVLAVGIGSIASAQTVVVEPVEPTGLPASMTFMQIEGDDDEGDGHDDDYQPSAEEEAVFERFDQCLADAGIDVESETEPDEAAFDAAFEQCDPILEELGEEFFGDMDLSAEDEAVFDRYDECLEGAGLDFDSETEPAEDVFDAAFEQCDPILDELSEELQAEFGDMDLSPEDEAVFDRYDECLEGAGLDFESEADIDEAAFDAAFEQCDPILEELSADAQALFEDCPEDE